MNYYFDGYPQLTQKEALEGMMKADKDRDIHGFKTVGILEATNCLLRPDTVTASCRICQSRR